MLKYTVNPIKLESELDRAFKRNTKYKWSDIYPTEEELISALIRIDVEIGEDVIRPTAPFYKGYEFIHSFATQLQKGNQLTDKQMTQAKRLAKEIKKATIVMNHVKKCNRFEPSRLTNKEILDRYRYLKSSINHNIEYIERYEQQQSARRKNDSIYQEIELLVQTLKKRSKGICRVLGKYADIGDMYIHIIQKLTKDDEILVMYKNDIETCEEFKNGDCFFIPRNKLGKIDWIPVELENVEYLYYEFGVVNAVNIKRGWWFKFNPQRTECAIYDGDIYISEIKNLDDKKVNTIIHHCINERKKYENL